MLSRLEAGQHVDRGVDFSALKSSDTYNDQYANIGYTANNCDDYVGVEMSNINSDKHYNPRTSGEWHV